MTEPYRRDEPLTRLDKLLDSVATSLYVPEDAAAIFLGKMREILEVGFVGFVPPPTPASTSAALVGPDVGRGDEDTRSGSQDGDVIATTTAENPEAKGEGGSTPEEEEIVEEDEREARRKIVIVKKG